MTTFPAQRFAQMPAISRMHPVPDDASEDLESIRQKIMAGRQADALRAAETLAVTADADTLHRLGDLLQSIGELDRAISLYRQALQPTPRIATLNNLAIALRKRGDARGALDAFQRARELGPVPPSVLNNIGNLLRQFGEIDQAIAAFQSSFAARPSDPDTLANYAAALLDAGRISEAMAAYQQAAQITPDHSAASSRLYAMHVLPCDAQRLAAEHNAWGDRFSGLADRTPFENDREPNRRLRVGLISPNFEQHPVGRFLLPLVEHIDRSAIAFFCYSDVAHEDAMTARFRTAAAGWRPIVGFDDDTVAQQIRADRIDILIDLALHLKGSRLKVFARRAAPVQATYLAYASTSGLATMDYRITDPHLDPPAAANPFGEKPIRLARSYWCYPAPPEAPPITPSPSVAKDHVTFGCLNNFRKISSGCLATWAELLRAVAGSRLIIHAHEGAHRAALRDTFEKRGVAGDRIDFHGFSDFAGYLDTYSQIDITLDTFPYTGGTTSCDALWMGVPLITFAGQTPVGRGGVSILTNVGLPELIAANPADYVRIAALLANDPLRRANLRQTLRDRMAASPLMQADAFCRDFESACRRMWKSAADERG